MLRATKEAPIKRAKETPNPAKDLRTSRFSSENFFSFCSKIL